MAQLAQTELKREPHTLFIVGSYSIGKEKAMTAVAEAIGSRVLVTARRAKMLKLSRCWDPAIYTETDAEDVSVRVSGMGGGTDHNACLSMLKAEPGRWKAVCSFRPTGWAFSKKQAREGYKPWMEHGGSTRVYSIPYSEHSSYEQLQNFVKLVKPRKIEPTVNAMQRGGRDAQVERFVESMDLRFDRSRLDAYFSVAGTARGATPDKAGPSRHSEEGFDFSSVNIDEQRRIMESLGPPGMGAVAVASLKPAWEAAVSSTAPTDSKEKLDGAVDEFAADGKSALREILGGALSESAMEGLLRATKGCPDRAAGLYFSSLGNDNATGSGQRAAGPSEAKRGSLVGCVVVVKGLEWKLFSSKTKIEAKLKELGALVKQRVTKETTHVLIPENQPAGSVTKCGEATIVRESWLVGHVRARQAKKEEDIIDLRSPSHNKVKRVERQRKKASSEKRVCTEGSASVPEKRTRRLRHATPAMEERVRRSLSERMLLVRRAPSRASSIRAEGEDFCVMGTTGNLYDVTIDKEVSCTCVDSGKGNQCKHALFVMLRVLRVERSSYLLCQRGLLSSELEDILRRHSGNDSFLANSNVRHRLESIRGLEKDSEIERDAIAGLKAVEQKPVEPDDVCGICFETLNDPEATEDTVWCQRGCGRTIHQDCMRRWAKMHVALSTNEGVKCPYCRTTWQHDCPSLPTVEGEGEVQMGERQDEGFINLGALQGMRTTRDESSYSEWFRR